MVDKYHFYGFFFLKTSLRGGSCWGLFLLKNVILKSGFNFDFKSELNFASKSTKHDL